MRELFLPSFLADDLISHAQQGWPEEVCGLIFGHGNTAKTFLPAKNVAPEPRTRFEIDPHALLRVLDFEDAGLNLLGVYHSHPRGPALVSATDLAQHRIGATAHVICSLQNRGVPVLCAFRVARDATSTRARVDRLALVIDDAFD